MRLFVLALITLGCTESPSLVDAPTDVPQATAATASPPEPPTCHRPQRFASAMAQIAVTGGAVGAGISCGWTECDYPFAFDHLACIRVPWELSAHAYQIEVQATRLDCDGNTVDVRTALISMHDHSAANSPTGQCPPTTAFSVSGFEDPDDSPFDLLAWEAEGLLLGRCHREFQAMEQARIDAWPPPCDTCLRNTPGTQEEREAACQEHCAEGSRTSVNPASEGAAAAAAECLAREAARLIEHTPAGQCEQADECVRSYRDDGDACLTPGALIGVENQVAGEVIPLTGTGLHLTYQSNRVVGFHPPGAPFRDARGLGFGGWSLSGHHTWATHDGAHRVLLGEGGTFPIETVYSHDNGYLVPGPAGEAWVFNTRKQHTATLDALTGQTLQSFGYDRFSRLISVSGRAEPIAFINYPAPDEVRISSHLDDETVLNLGTSGYLERVALPGDRQYHLAYLEGGLLEEVASPKAIAEQSPARRTFTYSARGLLLQDDGVDGSRLTLTREDHGDHYEVHRSQLMDADDTGERATGGIHAVWDDGARTITGPDGHTVESAVLSGAELEGHAQGYALHSPEGTLVSLVEPGDRWMGAPGRSLTRVSPVSETGLGSKTYVTEVAYVLNTDQPPPLGALALSQVEYATRLNGRPAGRTTFQIGEAGVSTVEQMSPAGRVATTILESGRPREVQAGHLHPVRFTWDVHGRPLSITQGDRRTTYTYDDVLRTVTVAQPDGARSRLQLDEALRIERLENPESPSEAVDFTYDLGDNLVSLALPGRSEHTWNHTLGGRPLDWTAPPIAEAPEGSTTTWRHTRDGRPTAIIHPDGREVALEYNDLGAPIRIGDITFTYQDRRLTTMTQGPGDPLHDGQPRPQVTLNAHHAGPMFAGLTQAIGDLSHIMAVDLDHDPDTWQVATMTLRDGFENTVALPHRFDADGLLTAIGDLALTRDTVGEADRVVLGALTTERTFNGFNELMEQTLIHEDTPLFRFELDRDSRGRITARETCRGPNNCVSWAYTYNTQGRLTAADANNGDFYRYTWDANGNRLTREARGEPAEGEAHYDAQDRVIQFGGATFTHNGMGQRTAVSGGPNGDWRYTYDEQGNLLRAQQTDGVDVEYISNPAGQRIGRRVDGGPWTWWLYGEGFNPIAEYDAHFRLRKVFVYGTYTHVPDYIVTFNAAGEQDGRYRCVTDAIGSVVGLVDDAGQWRYRAEFSPFGRQEAIDVDPIFPEDPMPFGFAGGLTDPDTGLIRFGARDFDPFTGRWLAKDPIAFAGGDTNLYAYVGGDPVNHIDPSGLQLVYEVDPWFLPTEPPHYREVRQIYQKAYDDWWRQRPYKEWGWTNNIFLNHYRKAAGLPQPVCTEYTLSLNEYLNTHVQISGVLHYGETIGWHAKEYIYDISSGDRILIGTLDPWNRVPLPAPFTDVPPPW